MGPRVPYLIDRGVSDPLEVAQMALYAYPGVP
jgi:hypothetical protein